MCVMEPQHSSPLFITVTEIWPVGDHYSEVALHYTLLHPLFLQYLIETFIF